MAQLTRRAKWPREPWPFGWKMGRGKAAGLGFLLMPLLGTTNSFHVLNEEYFIFPPVGFKGNQ